jgi:hypothetical protein
MDKWFTAFVFGAIGNLFEGFFLKHHKPAQESAMALAHQLR